MSDDSVRQLSTVPGAADRVAGHHARATTQRYVQRAIVAVTALLLALLLGIIVFGLGWATVALEGAVIAAILLIENRADPIIQRWARGARGEERVGGVLDALRDEGWFSLHDVQLDKGNIDHVVVGPAGIFTVETKSHRGRIHAIRIDGRMLKQAYADAKQIERITGLRAEPLLVFSNAYLIPAVTRRDGVVILPARMLGRHLRERHGTIPATRVLEVYNRIAAALPA